MMEKYLRIDPSGEIAWVDIDRVPYTWTDGSGPSLNQIYSYIGCTCIEQVRTVIPDVVILVDESGKLKDPPQALNILASRLYRGSLYGDPIVGPVIVAALRRCGPLNELDLFPLERVDLAKLSLFLGVELPADK